MCSRVYFFFAFPFSVLIDEWMGEFYVIFAQEPNRQEAKKPMSKWLMMTGTAVQHTNVDASASTKGWDCFAG